DRAGAGLGLLLGQQVGLLVVAVHHVDGLAGGVHRVLLWLAQLGVGQRTHVRPGAGQAGRITGIVIAVAVLLLREAARGRVGPRGGLAGEGVVVVLLDIGAGQRTFRGRDDRL